MEGGATSSGRGHARGCEITLIAISEDSARAPNGPYSATIRIWDESNRKQSRIRLYGIKEAVREALIINHSRWGATKSYKNALLLQELLRSKWSGKTLPGDVRNINCVMISLVVMMDSHLLNWKVSQFGY